MCARSLKKTLREELRGFRIRIISNAPLDRNLANRDGFFPFLSSSGHLLTDLKSAGSFAFQFFVSWACNILLTLLPHYPPFQDSSLHFMVY